MGCAFSKIEIGSAPNALFRSFYVNLEDVARQAGVSKSTVSRVINGEKNVRDTTRASVLDAH